jgi:hypothetical protein
MKSKIVTAYWMDAEGLPFQGGYSVRKQRYLGSIIAHCQNIKLPVVCYTHQKSLGELETIKKDFNLDNLEIKILELGEIKYHSEIDKIRNSDLETYIRELDGRGCEIMWGKFDALERELDGYDRVYWVDAGIQHPGIMTWGRSKKYNTPYDHHNPVHMTSWWTEYDVYNFPDFFNDKIFKKLDEICENKIHFITSNTPQILYNIFNEKKIINTPINLPFPIGGMFGGDTKILKKFIDNFWFLAEKIVNEKVLVQEDCIMKPSFDMLSKDEKIEFLFTSWSCCEHDKFHFEDWDESWNEPKPFYTVFNDILNYNDNE